MISKIEPVFNHYIDTYFAKIKKQATLYWPKGKILKFLYYFYFEQTPICVDF